MTCHMGEYTVLVLCSDCDQCGTPAEFRAKAAKPFELREIRDAWNKHHQQCDAARGVRAPKFEVPLNEWTEEPMAEITYI